MTAAYIFKAKTNVDAKSSSSPNTNVTVTDTHLGYMDKDQTRGIDSFKTFEEILQHAQRLDVCSH